MRPKPRKPKTKKAKVAKQLTIRGFDEEVDRVIREEARAGGVSLNQAVLRLLAKGAGLAVAEKRANVVGDTLREFFGTWTEEEAREFDRVVEEGCEVIDEDSWK